MAKYCLYDVNTRDFIIACKTLNDCFNFVKYHNLHGVEIGKYINEFSDDYVLIAIL